MGVGGGQIKNQQHRHRVFPPLSSSVYHPQTQTHASTDHYLCHSKVFPEYRLLYGYLNADFLLSHSETNISKMFYT